MRLCILDAGCRHKVSACAVTGQYNLFRVNAQLLGMVESILRNAVALVDRRRECLFRCKAVIHIPDEAVQPFHQSAAVAAVTVGAPLDEAAAMEIQQ